MANRLQNVNPTQAAPVVVQPDASSSTAPNRLHNVDLPPANPLPAPPPEPAKPDPNAYKPPDWLPGAGFLYKTNRVLENAATANLIDPVTAAAGNWMRAHGVSNTTPSAEQLRAETKQDKQDIGPVATTIADTAGYMAGPGRLLGPAAGRVAPYIGRYGAAATEGAVANALSSAGGQVGNPNGPNAAGIDPYEVAKSMGWGAVGGVVGQSVGDAAAAVGRRVADFVRGMPGRPSEQWDWRTRTAAGQDVRPDIETYRQSVPPASMTPERDAALTHLTNALGQSIDPGYGARLLQGTATLGSGALGFHDMPDWTHTLVGLVGGGAAARGAGDVAARGINTIDRNINVGQAFDRTYPALTGTQSTTDTSDWANVLRQFGVGASQ